MANDIEEFSLSDFFPYKVRVFYTAISNKIKEGYSMSHNLSSNEWRVMVVLNQYKHVTAKDVVNYSSIGKVNVSRGVADLEKRKFIEKHVDPTDRRSVLLCLTNKGKKVMSQLIPTVLDIEKQALTGLSQDEQATLLKLMDKVRRNADAITLDNSLS